MIIEKEAPVGKSLRKPGPITALEFYKDTSGNSGGAVQCAVTCGANGAPNIHTWSKPDDDIAEFLAQSTCREKFDPAYPSDSSAYISMAAFNPANTNRLKPTGRVVSNVVTINKFWLDVDCGPSKLAKHGPEKVYATQIQGSAAIKSFMKSTGLIGTHLVDSGTGLHVYFVLTEALPYSVWHPMALRLAVVAAEHGLKIDNVTSDAARIMRAPGSIHQENGKRVAAMRLVADHYTPEAFGKLLGFDPSAAATFTPLARIDAGTDARVAGINDEVLNGTHKPYSYVQAAERCGAMRQAAQNNGRDTPYPVWFLALRSAALSTEGRSFAHEISSGHPDYQEADTDRKLDSLTGGPASCKAWAAAYGAGGPCDSCDVGGA
jgi:hypothetical protein